MKVAVTTRMVPFERSTAEAIGVDLVRELEQAGHDAELIRIPFRWRPFTVLPEQLAMAGQIALGPADRVISLSFPAYLAPHRNQVVWLSERFEDAYDASDEGGALFPRTEGGDRVRQWVVDADTRALTEARRVFVGTDALGAELMECNGISAETLPVPASDRAREAVDWRAIVERLLA